MSDRANRSGTTPAAPLPRIDVFQVIAALPSGKWLALGALRAFAAFFIALTVWHATDMEGLCQRSFRGAARYTISKIEKPIKVERVQVPDPKAPVSGRLVWATQKTMRTIEPSLKGQLCFNLFVPFIILSAMPLRRWRRTLLSCVIATLLLILFHLVQTPVHAYILYYDKNVWAPEQQIGVVARNGILLSVNGIVAPVAAVIAGSLASRPVGRGVSSLWRLLPLLAARMRPPRRRHTSAVGRNDPCPCGSGKKYKKCCGAE